MKKVFALALSIIMLALCCVGCGSDTNAENPVATIVFTGFGSMQIELYPDKAPETVKNFISLANSGFYDGLTIHRLDADFVIQGGDPKGNGTGGPGYVIKGEFTANGVENDIKHEKGVLSMARGGYSYDSAGSQFFICTETSFKITASLDGQYAAFGKIIDEEGFETLDKIVAVGADSSEKPLKTVTIESIKIDTKGVTYGEPNKMEDPYK